MDKVNWNFISELEGKAVDTAYVPSDNSGVTIGTGVDLKMKNAEFLETLGVPSDIIEVLEPYFGLRGEEAGKYLKDNPLVLSAVDVKILDESIQKYHANKIKSDYEKDSGKSWSALTSNQQTVITSVGFQYGNMKHKTPNFWNGVISNDWKAVTNELNNFGDKYDTRREKEAKLLKERELAGEVQKSLFPDISSFENFIYATNVPARDVSGDYFDVVNVNNNEYFFTLADVSGKGIKAGMYMAKASSIFRTLSNLSYPLEKVVFGVNNELVEAKFKGMFVTAVFGKFNIETGDVTFVNAGHESIMVFDRNKNFEFIKSELPPIGIIKYFTESMVKSRTINLKDKTFVVYTDGVTEGYLKNGEELGAEGVERIVTSLDNITPKNIVDSIANELNWGGEKLRDDITCLALDLKNTELVQLKKKKKE